MAGEHIGSQILLKISALLFLCPLVYAKPPEDSVREALGAYHRAMEAKSVEQLAQVMDPGLLVLEGVHKNVGWADYRDNHIGPEMAEWKRFRVLDPRIVEVAVYGDIAYAVEQSTAVIVAADKTVALDVAETFVLLKGPSGWKIRHLHFSGKKKQAPQPAKP